MRVLFIGDIFGRYGRKATAWWVPRLHKERRIDIIVANVENAAGGNGITENVVEEILDAGVDVMTTGNHAWDKRDGVHIIEEGRVLRPANHPTEVPGIGSTVFQTADGNTLGVINVQGRLFMKPMDCPFKACRRELTKLRSETLAVLVDFHAEATSEKQALGWYLDGQVSAVIGTHTHVPTADERILPNGTAYLSDAGMTGPYNSIIGMEPRGATERLMTGVPSRAEQAKDGTLFCGAIIDIDSSSGNATHIERVMLPYPSKETT